MIGLAADGLLKVALVLVGVAFGAWLFSGRTR